MKRITKLRKLAIACGGTGGHFLPGLTIARHFQGHRGRVLMLLSGKNIEDQHENAEGYSLEVIKLNPTPPPRSLRSFPGFVYGTLRGTLTAVQELRKFRPDAVLSMGSFAALPPVLAAKILGIPIFLHDGNARVGRANRFFSSWARLMGTAFPAVNGEKVRCPYEYIGMPIRPELDYRPLEKTQAIEKLNALFGVEFKAELPTLLIFGGSQGAQAFNELFPRMMLDSGRTGFQVLHLTGAGKFDCVKAVYETAKFPVLCLPGTSGMHWFYQAADLVICRAGGSTLAELCLFGKFAFLIPYPFAAEQHQADNARFMVTAGAAELIDSKELTTQKAAELFNRWLADPAAFTTRGKLALAYAKPDAAAEMLWLIDSLL
ncbi:MAG: UDP-N-acetylglucosamine--N-acetylmuramyl-(pentapeptide) pyrophosphoryl-undecaprenol N-acetylglucosamine transferase [Victivallaceae bacterium]|nr:UDP-N-acetylglucosamine--N-acetylmuramyl-(pentapeptide) pyrophosphoryl-undecaprenol N-acetylglucosamine transferase [Victivallaceae bacterium]